VGKVLPVVAFAGGVVMAAAGWWFWPSPAVQRSAAELMDAVMWNREPIGGPFALTDHNGRPRTDTDFRGKVMLIYFGFTYCSDICPVDLQSIAGAMDKLGAAAKGVQPIFITVDPEQDTPEQLKTYVGLIHPELLGLTGTPKQIRDVAAAFRVYFAKTEPTRKNSAIDHFGLVFLLDAEGRYIGFLPPGTPAERMADAIRPHVGAKPGRGVIPASG
jgi:protein SCO1/2